MSDGKTDNGGSGAGLSTSSSKALFATLTLGAGSSRRSHDISASPRDSWQDFERHVDRHFPGWHLVAVKLVEDI